MQQQEQPRWRPTRRQVLWVVIIAALAFLIIVICGYLFGWKWTGLVADANYPKKTLWDWLDLLIVPVVLAIGGYLFTRSESQRTQEAADQQRTLDRELADERRQDNMLQAYLDGKSELLSDEKRPLHRAELGDRLSTVARARTLTVLTRLGGERKGSVVRFLYESGLIHKGARVLDLSGADLSLTNLGGVTVLGALQIEISPYRANLSSAVLVETNLYRAYLSFANLSSAVLNNANLGSGNLSFANLSGANLTRANLVGANLYHTRLSGANLSGADLSGADLRNAFGVTEEQLEAAKTLEGATMPNGQQYEDWLKDKGRA